MKRFLFAAAAAALIAGTAQAKTLVYCSEGSPESFNPSLSGALTTFDASSLTILNRLVQFIPGTTEVAPALTESWEVSEDGLEYTFHLREGVKFQTTESFTPSRNFNADDVLYSFNRQLDPDHPDHGLSGGTYDRFNAMSMPDLINEIVKIDDLTVKFVLNRPEAPMIANLAMHFAAIMSAEYAEAMRAAGTPEKIDLEPVGTGPFQLVDYQKDTVIRYKAHPDYWDGKAAIDDLIFAITPDASVRLQKLKAGECHLMPYPNPADLENIRADPNLLLMEQEGLNVGYLAYNTQVAPFDNPKVRKALNMAINKEAIIDAVFQGTGQVAKNPIPPIMWSYSERTVDDPYAPETAKKMLEEEGVTDLKMNIWAMPVQRPYNPNARRMAELIQEDFAEVGVEAEIVSYEWGEYLARSKAMDRDGAVLLGWTGDNGDPDNFLAVLLGCDAVGGSNRAQWCDPAFDNLIQKAKVTSNVEERTLLYEAAQMVFKNQAPWATIAHSVVFKPMSKKVSGYKIDPFGGHYFYGVDIVE